MPYKFENDFINLVSFLSKKIAISVSKNILEQRGQQRGLIYLFSKKYLKQGQEKERIISIGNFGRFCFCCIYDIIIYN